MAVLIAGGFRCRFGVIAWRRDSGTVNILTLWRKNFDGARLARIWVKGFICTSACVMLVFCAFNLLAGCCISIHVASHFSCIKNNHANLMCFKCIDEGI